MKHILYIALVMTANSQAQTQETNQNNQQRPSWSQGLPERQKAPTTSQPSIDIKTNDRQEFEAPSIEKVTTEQPTFKLEQLETPQFEYQVEPKAPVAELSTEQQSMRLGTLSKQRNRVNNANETNPLHKEYKWKVLSTTPIDMPSGLNRHANINVNIFIKPDGSVSKVTSTDPNVTSSMLRYVSESIENWLFEAPSELGINDVMSKGFAIEIKS